ncbi:MAG: LPS export ABC transporter periplasmic protein LptC [Gammaproteobacteria bacterium]|nr:LPS export ABC transporter periplasmic protein LptC [Gammaproteobacteria bacterium]
MHIQTESLTVFPERDFAETDMPVSLDNVTSHTIAGGGMRAWLAEGRFKVFASEDQRVVTVLSPGTFHRDQEAQP